nr:nitroreductase family protein [Candidatus Sigynarchaeota archaeon]
MTMEDNGSQGDAAWKSFKSIVETRRSYKQPFSDESISRDIISRCIDAARWAPSAHNAQPWRFITFYHRDKGHQALREHLLKAMGEKRAQDSIADGNDPVKAIAACTAANAKFVAVPVLILALMDASVLDMYPDESRRRAEHLMGTQSVAAALQTLLLALHVSGLNACWCCAPIFTDGIVHDVLGVPAAWQAQAFITAGKGTGKPPVKESRGDGRIQGSARHPLASISFEPGHFVPKQGGARS